MNPPLVVVEWLDAAIHYDDHEPGDICHEGLLVRQAGWLLQRDKKGVTLAFSYSEEGGTGEQIFIPAGLVKRVIKSKDG